MRRWLILLLLLCRLSVPVQARETGKYVALTFDDGPSGRYTRMLLEGLEQRGAVATFFLCGYRLETWGDLAGEIRSRGHEIGLHGYSHDSMASMSLQTLRRELEQTQRLLPEGGVINLMRPPGGLVSPTVSQCARERNLSVISWSVDPKDWATDDAELILERMLEQTGDGSVILLHDMSGSSVEAALALVDALKAQGYQFLTVSQLAMLRLCQLQPGQMYESFCPKM